MNVLIPMAGEGSRFQKEGYLTPKPLIPIESIPMVVKAANSLPKGDNYIFICREFHIKKFQIDIEIKQYFPDAEIISIDQLTEGQASTCLFATELINNNQELLIGASDNGVIYDKTKFEEAKELSDCLVFSFRNNVTVVPNPAQYGWVVSDQNCNAEKVSVKIPISDNPMNDHAIVGAFWFKKGKYFVDAATSMIHKNRRINNEFYVDECINDLIDAGLKVKVFEIDYYIGWGTPNDLRSYEYWNNFFKDNKLNI